MRQSSNQRRTGQMGLAKWDWPSGTGQVGLAKWDWPSGTGQVGLDCHASLAMTTLDQCLVDSTGSVPAQAGTQFNR
jgi:hypothetical protein